MRLLATCLSAATLFCLLASPATAENKPFNHPGLFTSQAELAAIQKRVASKNPDDPIYAGYVSTTATRFADADFQPEVIAQVKRMGLGQVVDPPVKQRDSAMVSYTLALKWATAGDAAARDKAISIMDAWADGFERNVGDENRFLDSAWVVTVWCAAGELIRYAEVGGKTADWPAERVDKFKAMIRNLEAESSQIIVRPFNPGSNWGTSSMLGDMAAGVFLDDRAMYERGRNALLKYLPNIIKKDGYCNEVFRDPWHGIVALTGTIQAAEIGRHQDDLSVYHATYEGQDEPRLLVSIRWYADPLRGIPVAMPPMGGARWKPEPWEFNATKSSRNTGGFEMALNFYEWIEPRDGLGEFRDAVLKTYRPSGQDNSIFIESDTLTHGDLDDPRWPNPQRN